MSKVRKQMIINLLLVLVSAAVIVLAKSIPAGELLPFGSYLGSDIVFVVISALVGTMGWRYIEGIRSWGWDLISLIALVAFAIFYGAAMAISNCFVKDLIITTLIVFPVIYIKENVMIYRHFKQQREAKRNNQKRNYVGYQKRDHQD